jgi:hypothetical protein
MKVLFLALALISLGNRAIAASVSPAIGLSGTHVVATGFLPNHDVVIFGVGATRDPNSARFVRYTDTITSDVAGTVRYEAPEAIPARTIWFAIDTQTREYAVSAGSGTVLRPSLSPPTTLLGKDAGKDALSFDRRLMEFLVVRPGSGVWIGSCGRNSLKDLNRGKNGAMQVAVAQLDAARKSVGHTNSVSPSDLVIAIDAETLEYFVGSPRQP